MYTVSEIAKLRGISRQAVNDQIRRKNIPYESYANGKIRLIRKDDLGLFA